jgi:predicted nucleic acid-binding protein
LSFYLDTSILVPLHIEEPASARLHKWLQDAGEPMIVASLAVLEFRSVVSRLIRMKQVTPAIAADIISDFDRWRGIAATYADNLPVDIHAAAELIREPHPPLLPADAIHLATCKRLGATFVAHDGNLLEIASRLSVACLSP